MSNFTKIIKEICEENDIAVKGFSGDWAFVLEHGGVQGLIYGYQFGLDLSSSASAACKDKAIASDLMEYYQIPHVEHICVMSPGHPEYLYGNDGSYRALLKYLDKYGVVVCKDNQGTGGDLVFVASNPKELEYAVHRIFAESGSLAVCPYQAIEEEIRCIMLDKELQVAFLKERPALQGDGISTVQELLAKKIKEEPTWADQLLSGVSGIHYDTLSKDKSKQNLHYVPQKGEEYTLSWKHNLGQGAKAKLLFSLYEEKQEECEAGPLSTLPEEVVSLAKKVVTTFGLRFVSVDIIRVDGKYQVLEVNNGVMMENLAGTDAKTYRIAKKIYQKAIMKMLQMSE